MKEDKKIWIYQNIFLIAIMATGLYAAVALTKLNQTQLIESLQFTIHLALGMVAMLYVIWISGYTLTSQKVYLSYRGKKWTSKVKLRY